MPRFVRASWIEVNADGRATSTGVGPRMRDGYASARITLRTADGAVSDEITLDAGGRNGDGAARLALDIPASFVVDVELEESGRTHLVARPR